MEAMGVYNRCRDALVSALGTFRSAYSRIYYISEGTDWVIRRIGNHLAHQLSHHLGIPMRVTRQYRGIRCQVVHFGSRHVYFAGELRDCDRSNRIVMTWFHGDGAEPHPDNQRMIRLLPERIAFIDQVVTASTIAKRRLMGWGVPESKITLVPLGVDLKHFQPATESERQLQRTRLGIPKEAICIGSFQKDGKGWGTGTEPKLVKGPDLFLEAVKQLASRYPIVILLTGPARGYIMRGLEALGVTYRHVYVPSPEALVSYYHCLDLYLVTARDEGGPLALLESMATGVPLVSTRVGMANDVIQHGQNGYLADVEDVNGIVESAARLIEQPAQRGSCRQRAFHTVQAYDWPHVAVQYYERVYRPLLSGINT